MLNWVNKFEVSCENKRKFDVNYFIDGLVSVLNLRNTIYLLTEFIIVCVVVRVSCENYAKIVFVRFER